MSSKGRKPVEENEFYVTPPAAVLALLESDLVRLPTGTWVEPCVGTGSIVRTVNSVRRDVNWIMCDINPAFDSFLSPLCRPERDVLQPYQDWVYADWAWGEVDVAIFNPPFSLTLQFIEAAFRRARWIVCLQRTNFFGSQQRAAWLRNHCPDVYSLPFRPSFRLDGSTDSIEYSWFVWPPTQRLERGEPVRVGTGNLSRNRRRRTGVIAMLDVAKGGQLNLIG